MGHPARSSPPPAPGPEEARAKYLVPTARAESKDDHVVPLRAGGKRNLNARRDFARERERPILAKILQAAGITDDELAGCFGRAGDDKFGAELRTVSAPMTPGEAAALLPIVVAVRLLLAHARGRIGSELKDGGLLATNNQHAINMRVALSHFDAIEVLLSSLEQ